MKTRIPSRAYHEAGHAIAAGILGMRVTVASIETTGYPLGWRLSGGVLAGFDHYDGARNRNEAERAVTAGLAGEQAERLWSTLKPWRRSKSAQHASFSGDHAYVDEMLRPFIKRDADKQRTIKRLKEAARSLLTKNWSSVEALAAKLAERKVLKGKELKRLVAPKRSI
jgi:ATP-dependent Zn protease